MSPVFVICILTCPNVHNERNTLSKLEYPEIFVSLVGWKILFPFLGSEYHSNRRQTDLLNSLGKISRLLLRGNASKGMILLIR